MSYILTCFVRVELTLTSGPRNTQAGSVRECARAKDAFSPVVMFDLLACVSQQLADVSVASLRGESVFAVVLTARHETENRQTSSGQSEATAARGFSVANTIYPQQC